MARLTLRGSCRPAARGAGGGYPAPIDQPLASSPLTLVLRTSRANAARERHPAGQEDSDALLHGNVRVERPVARHDEHIAQVQMVGRHVDGDHGFRALAAVDGELLGEESEYEAARPIL